MINENVKFGIKKRLNRFIKDYVVIQFFHFRFNSRIIDYRITKMLIGYQGDYSIKKLIKGEE